MIKTIAKKIIEQYLNDKFKYSGFEVIIRDDNVIENDDLFVFFYNSKEFLIDKNDSYELVGNSPIIFDKKTMDIFNTGTSQSIDFYINLFYTDKSKLSKI